MSGKCNENTCGCATAKDARAAMDHDLMIEAKAERRADRIDARREAAEHFDFERDQGVAE